MGHDAHRVPRPAGAAGAGDALDHDVELDQDVEEVIAAVLTASRMLVGVSARALGRTAPSLTLPQLRALVVLDGRGPVKLATLADALGVNPSTALRMVDRLEAAGSVTRQAKPGNRREVVLSLTDPGRGLVAQVLADRHAEIATLVSRLPVAQRAGLIEALRALTDAADEPRVAPRPAPPPEPSAPMPLL
ncbi:MarR family transcriptional regulator [Streptomyces sp. NPDC048637]|uniref:MarR family winged helix-turn-helix transcriptional regulator n=1 Tax=Streptomyces sp. NPDC048637 TaxID=3155636 RepID=UPI003429A9BD